MHICFNHELNPLDTMNMINNKLKFSLLALSVSAFISACGGGGGDGRTTTTSTNVTSSGTITGFGSVIVNKVRYATTAARVVRNDGTLIDDSPSDDDLKAILGEGNIVKVRGTRTDDSNGIANTITVDDETVGDIEIGSIDGTNATFVVNGQTIFVTPDTIIDDSIIGNSATADAAFGTLSTTLDSLLTGVTRVEVAGFPVQGGIQATRIEDFNGSATAGTGDLGTDDEIKGFVSNPGAASFLINGTTVSFGAGTTFEDNFTLADGQLVEVHGTPTSPTTFDATLVELDDDLFDADFSGEFEIEGVIQSIVPDGAGGGDVTINGKTYTVGDISALSEDLRIEIKGVLQADGSIVITRVQDEAEDTIRTEDLVLIPAGASSFQTRLGLVIQPSDRTRLGDDTIANDDNLTLAEFLANVDGQRVEVRGFPLSGNTAWTRAEIEDSNELDCRLRGPAADITGEVNDFTFKIAGVTINVAQVSDNNFEGANDQPIGRQDFFDQLILSPGVIVQATSDANGVGCVAGTLTAREVEFEPENMVLFDDGGANNGLDNEVFGPVTNVTTTSFVLGGETIGVTDDTLIDDSIVEDARGVELDPVDLPLGGLLPETLPDLLNNGSLYVVVVDRSSGSPVALQIED